MAMNRSQDIAQYAVMTESRAIHEPLTTASENQGHWTLSDRHDNINVFKVKKIM